jgi:hypothetical protein
VATVKEVFKSKLPEFENNQHPARTEMRFRSSIECVEMAMVRPEATTDERKLRPPGVKGNPDVAVRVHRAMLSRAIADPQVRDSLAPQFVKLLDARFKQNRDGSSQRERKPSADLTKWSINLDWLSLDFND